MSRALVGTSGWGYPSWQPGFYPAGTDRSEYLSFYAAQLPCRRAERDEVPASLGGAVPLVGRPGSGGLPVCGQGADGLERRLATFEERVRCLGDRLGCVRVVVERPRDDGFLELLLGSADPTIRYALDLRDPSWDGVEERLAASGAVRVDDDSGRAGWAYLRYRELHYELGEVDESSSVRRLVNAGIETFAFFRHGDLPDAPAAALRVAASIDA